MKSKMSSIKKTGMILDKELPDLRVENEAALLGRAGFHVILLCLNYRVKRSYYEKRSDYTIYHKACRKWFVNKLRPFSGTIFDIYSVIWWQMIKRFIRREEIDILHLHDLYMGLPLIGKKISYLVDLHENYPETVITYNWSTRFPLNIILRRKEWKRHERRVLSEATGIIVLSKIYAEQLEEEYTGLNLKGKFCVYPNVPDLSLLKSLERTKEIYSASGKYTIFYFGVIAERRGIFDCFEALKLLEYSLPDLHLLLVGPVDNADKPRFENYLEELERKTTHISWVNFKDFASLVQEVDVCISPIKKNKQHESGVANKIFQYMYFEKPMIVSNCLPQQEIVETHKCGYVYKSGDINDLAEKIQQSYQNRGDFKNMGKRGREAVEKNYNTEIMGENLIKFYQNHINRSLV